MGPLRKVEKKVGDSWVECKMQEIKCNDIVRMFEDDGQRVEHEGDEWFATSDAFLTDGKVWGIQVIPYKRKVKK